MDFDELRDTTMDPTKRALLQITVEQAALADEVCSILMGDDALQRRHHPDQRGRRSLPRHLGGRHHARTTDNSGGRNAALEDEVVGYIEPIEINLEMERPSRVLDVGHRLASVARRA